MIAGDFFGWLQLFFYYNISDRFCISVDKLGSLSFISILNYGGKIASQRIF